MDEFPARGGGLGRVLLVVVLLHVVGIGGVLVYKALNREDPLEVKASTDKDPVEAQPKPIAEAIPPTPRTNGKAIIVDHPNLEGHVRYRVGTSETLQDIARQFNAEEDEVEKLNSLRPAETLYVGQWLTVPDHRKGVPNELISIRASVVKEREKPKQPAVTEPVPKVALPKPVPSQPEDRGAQTQPVVTKPKPKPQPEVINTRKVTEIPAPATTAAATIYKVKPGDTAYRIALKYGIQWQALLEHNGIKDPRQLQAGQTIKIPAR